MRRRYVCPKCDHRTILLIRSVRQVVGSQFRAAAALRDLFIASVALHPVGDAPPLAQAGALAAAVCKGCGFVEWYVADPGSIPVDGDLVKEVTAPDDGPYRT